MVLLVIWVNSLVGLTEFLLGDVDGRALTEVDLVTSFSSTSSVNVVFAVTRFLFTLTTYVPLSECPTFTISRSVSVILAPTRHVLFFVSLWKTDILPIPSIPVTRHKRVTLSLNDANIVKTPAADVVFF